MQQEEGQENEKGFRFGPLGRWARYGFAAVGAFASLAGLLLVAFAYVTVSPSVDVFRADSTAQLDNAGNAITSLDASLASTSSSLGMVPSLSDNLSIGFSGFASATGSLADGISALADKTAVLSPDGAESMRSAAVNLHASAETMNTNAQSLSGMSSSMRDSQRSIDKVRSDLSKAKADLAKAKGDVSGLFGTISTLLVVGCGMFALVFIALGAYSLALFL